MDHLIRDHEHRNRLWRKRDGGGYINDIEIKSSNGKTYLMEKLFIIGFSAVVAFLTRVSWQDKVKNLSHRIGLDKLINKIDKSKSKIIAFLKNIRRKNVPIKEPVVVVPRRGNNFIPKVVVTEAMITKDEYIMFIEEK